MRHLYIKTAYTLFFFFLISSLMAQSAFLKTDGQRIVNAQGENVILRGAGLGGWMLQEGYMLQTASFAGTQYKIKEHIEALVGNDGLEAFYDAWLSNYCTKADVDSMAAWGFNSIRLPMHYNLFTLPIEDEPVAGQDTWLNRGFEMVDNLLDWCEANQMYLILDLHAAPGGQGKNADISDYNPDKPSLWESPENQRKTIALWRKLAERYANEPWIGGYDLINEPNWDFENSGNQNGCNCNQNKPLWDLQLEIINAIREVDANHLIVIEGNCWGNNYNGLPKINNWDNNLVMSFHKYWNYNDEASISGMLNHRTSQNVPLWLGESGENSNTWFANAIGLAETNNIGWSWWPFKKIDSRTGNVMVPKTSGYQQLLNYWEGNGSKPSTDQALEWLLEQADMLKLENCSVNYDVNDAMFRQAQGDKNPMPFKQHQIPGNIFATDYDLGANNFAYFDNDTATYHSSSDEYTAWNQGYGYRNDGVDIEACTDNITNGYNVGWTQKGEWLLYTVDIDSTAAYSIDFRYAANAANGKFHLQLNGQAVTAVQSLPATGGWTSWKTHTIQDVVLEKGKNHLKLYIDNEGFNINYLNFHSAKALSTIEPDFIYLQTDTSGQYIQMISNIGYSANQVLNVNDFSVSVDGSEVEIASVQFEPSNQKIISIQLTNGVIRANRVNLSFNSVQLSSPFGAYYYPFLDRLVQNKAPEYVVLPAKIEAENYTFNNGLVHETCTDAGGGENLGYTAYGDYVDYRIYNSAEGEYSINYRVASQNSGRFETRLINGDQETALHAITVSTGGWQTWRTQSANAVLPAGKSVLRLFVINGEFNINWFEIKKKTSVDKQQFNQNSFRLIHHSNGVFEVMNINGFSQHLQINCFDLNGRKVFDEKAYLESNQSHTIQNEIVNKGIYLIQLISDKGTEVHRVQVF